MQREVGHTDVEFLKELHRDLARKWKLHGPRMQQTWRSLNAKQRKEALQAGQFEGRMLEHPRDESMGNVYLFMPEWNPRDLSRPDSDYTLDLMKHRATMSLWDRYAGGINGGPGDSEVIHNSIYKEGLRYVDPCRYSFSSFLTAEEYGEAYTVGIRQCIAKSGWIWRRLCRPHHSRIDGFKLLEFAKRLKRQFGWSEELFEVA